MGVQQKQSSRLFMILGAVLTIVAMGGVYFVARSASTSANSGSVKVLVATREVPLHTVFSSLSDVDTWFAPVAYPSTSKPVGALSSAADFQTQLLTEGKQANTETIYPNEPVLTSMFQNLGSTRQGYTGAFDVPKGEVAISLSVTAVNEVAGSVQPGDSVDLIASFLPGGGGGGPTDLGAPGTTAHVSQTQFVLQNLKVLALGQLTAASGSSSSTAGSPSSSSSSNGGTVLTFAVNHQTALIIQHLKDFSGSWDLSVVLRSAYSRGSYTTTPVTPEWYFSHLRDNFTH